MIFCLMYVPCACPPGEVIMVVPLTLDHLVHDELLIDPLSFVSFCAFLYGKWCCCDDVMIGHVVRCRDGQFPLEGLAKGHCAPCPGARRTGDERKGCLHEEGCIKPFMNRRF